MKTSKNREAKSDLVPLYLKNHSIGKVHSKFNSGLNVQFGDSLIFISSIHYPLSAFGLNIEEEKLKQVLNSARIGDVVVNKEGRLILYTINEIIKIDYKNIENVDLKLPKICCSISHIPQTKLYNHLERIQFEQFIGIELDETTRSYINMLLNSDRSDANINSEIIKFFSGRGKGLTPSGDDILTGYTLALMLFGWFDNWIAALKLGITKDTTTMISVAYLRALLEGYASEYFIQLARLVNQKDANVIDEAIKKIQTFGHTSGNDTLFGFYIGLRFLLNQDS